MSEEVKNKSKLYKNLIGLAKEVKEQIQIPFKVKKAEKDLEQKILDVEQKIAEANCTIEEKKCIYPADWDAIIKAIDNKDLLERKLTQLNDLKKELFGDE